ncbi:hypothetical protein H1P_1030010 [Hyella patelloides LEGE 07179]|uniref:Uncharacterized protein n=1 Tax=Hyella patelloides LEGE 07179 TaxID=945734 RepID=A0A563VJ50_9CYAN|nr:hypothetical protein [Hyella patelloides]VEP11411.1 hypothetical protein H1P_1030010 [Hyella patelloides LEGE 07179]
MFKVGDIVQHKVTGKLGTVVGYGCRVLDRTYCLTLKVKPLKGFYFRSPIEDTISKWRFVPLGSPQLFDRGSLKHKLVA